MRKNTLTIPRLKIKIDRLLIKLRGETDVLKGSDNPQTKQLHTKRQAEIELLEDLAAALRGNAVLFDLRFRTCEETG